MNCPFYLAFDPTNRRPMALSGELEWTLKGLRPERRAIAHVALFDTMPSLSVPVPLDAKIVWPNQ